MTKELNKIIIKKKECITTMSYPIRNINKKLQIFKNTKWKFCN